MSDAAFVEALLEVAQELRAVVGEDESGWVPLSRAHGTSLTKAVSAFPKPWPDPAHTRARLPRERLHSTRWIAGRHNKDHALRLEVWPESYLERPPLSRPALLAEFHLR